MQDTRQVLCTSGRKDPLMGTREGWTWKEKGKVKIMCTEADNQRETKKEIKTGRRREAMKFI